MFQAFTIELGSNGGSMAAAEFLGQKNGILIIVGVDHIGLHGDVPFCMEDSERQKDQWSEGF